MTVKSILFVRTEHTTLNEALFLGAGGDGRGGRISTLYGLGCLTLELCCGTKNATIKSDVLHETPHPSQ